MGWKWSVWILAAAGVVAVVFLVADWQRGPTSVSVQPGQHTPAPNFTLADLSGRSVSLSDYRGKVVLLDFWATWCDPCRDEIPHFVRLQSEYGGQGLQILGVSMDDGPEPVREFYQHFHINYPVVMGNAKTGELYGGILGLPVAFLIDRDGRIYSRHIGATDSSVFESEISTLLKEQPNAH
jgi:cytochrome c biogenesis protein CcmG/thiol:disulfide interchange protein DsbE